ncbi:protein-tyrosine phosphatase-like protein [Paraphysoderma sedebokerense]|nr:protein-tyrosine phosphatase-like protein [Paraphysoderma sedebokerense]KAI9137864.1 protein-tyrosine phosphatase-like protein [Paraphysoderma sedebokerense]
MTFALSEPSSRASGPRRRVNSRNLTLVLPTSSSSTRSPTQVKSTLSAIPQSPRSLSNSDKSRYSPSRPSFLSATSPTKISPARLSPSSISPELEPNHATEAFQSPLSHLSSTSTSPKSNAAASEPIEIIPNLFLGSEHHAGNLSVLQKLGIKYVMNCACEVENPFQPYMVPVSSFEHGNSAPVTPTGWSHGVGMELNGFESKRGKENNEMERPQEDGMYGMDIEDKFRDEKLDIQSWIRDDGMDNSMADITSAFPTALSTSDDQLNSSLQPSEISTTNQLTASPVPMSPSKDLTTHIHSPKQRFRSSSFSHSKLLLKSSPTTSRQNSPISPVQLPSPPVLPNTTPQSPSTSTSSNANPLSPSHATKSQIPKQYLHLRLPHHTTSLTSYLPLAATFISNSLQSEQPILVHCQLGVSRSASIVIGYIMKTRNLGFHEAYDYVKSKSNKVCPNLGLVGQLVEWENELKRGEMGRRKSTGSVKSMKEY